MILGYSSIVYVYIYIHIYMVFQNQFYKVCSDYDTCKKINEQINISSGWNLGSCSNDIVSIIRSTHAGSNRTGYDF
jgi:hypothetical protein